MRALAQFLGACLLFAALGGAGYFGLELLTRQAASPPGGSGDVELDVAPPELARQRPDGRLADGAPALASSQSNSEEGDWGALNNEGVRALDAGDADRAVELFERCFAARPDEPVFRNNLAQALIAQALAWRGEGAVCEECLELLERALELSPEREDLAALVAKWRTEADVQHGFWEESSLYFDLSYDGSRSEILRDSYRVLNRLDQIYADLREHFDYDPVREGHPRIPVVLYARADFDQVTGLGDWAGGAFDGAVRVPVGDDTSLDDPLFASVLKHEIVHAFVHATGGKHVPGWLNEGLAQWLEPGSAAAVVSARERLAGKALFPLSELQGTLSSWQEPEQISLAYAQSLVFCDFVAGQYGERVLFRLVRGCGEGQAPADVFEAAVGVALDAVLADLTADL